MQKVVTHEELQALKQRFLDVHDKNRDGKIDIKEASVQSCVSFEEELCNRQIFQLAKLLPLDENFFLIFRYNIPLESGVDFIRVSEFQC